MIKGMMFSGAVAAPGQKVFESDYYGDLVATSWVVPAGVYSISAVLVNPAHGSTVLKRGTTTLLDGFSVIGGNVGGGNGGNPGTHSGRGPAGEAGAGGAGGYSGNGGMGGSASTGAMPGSYTANAGLVGSGGGGGGGCSGASSGWSTQGDNGGGVGLLGIGANGAGGAVGYSGGAGSPLGGNLFGGGVVNSYGSSSGGNLRWANNVAVTPGETLTVQMVGGSMGGYTIFNSRGGVRILWGGGRSYPSNALDM